ncbi:MAG: AAA family ATPase [Desulfobulbaceae bacterium]
MYLSFYHLKKNPFQINTDHRFLWLGPKHEEGLATLKYGVRDRKGFLIMTGDIGTGKTTLVNALLNSLGENVLVAVIRDPNLELLDFFNYIAHAFNMGREFERKGSFLIHFEKFLVEAHAAGKTVLLIVDEAQRITQEILEEVRLLSNIERHDCKLINIFFVGQIEFNDILLRPENRAIRQRITVNYTIPPLTEIETGMYIKHRLEVAGFNEEIYAFSIQESGSKEFDEYNLELPKNQNEIFSFGAVKEIFSYSRGYPRLINIICDRCLLTGFVEDASTITQEIVRECRAELKIPESGLAREDKQPGYSEIQEPIVPQVSGRTDGKHHVEAADNGNLIPEPEANPAPLGPVEQKKHNRSFIRLISLLSVLLIVIVIGYANLSQNGESVRLANLVKKYAGGLWQSTDRTAEHVAEDEPKTNKQVSPPVETGTGTEPQLPAPAETRTEPPLPAPAETGTEPPLPAPPEQKESAEQTNLSGEQKNEKKTSDLAESARTASQDKGKNIQVQPLHLFEKHIIPFSSDTNYPLSTSLKELDMLVESLLQQPQFKIIITGYSDSSGNESYNLKLSEFRANTVKSFLIGRGLPESRIKAEGLGSQNPIASNDSLSGRIANRRVEIEIIHPHDE